MKLIPLSTTGKNKGKYFAQVDDADYMELSKYKWSVHTRKEGVYYVQRNCGKNAWIKMHRQIMGVSVPTIEIDHKDGNGLNNQRNNLRIANRTENNRNKKSRGGTSKYVGVHWNKAKKAWCAKICVRRFRSPKF